MRGLLVSEMMAYIESKINYCIEKYIPSYFKISLVKQKATATVDEKSSKTYQEETQCL